MLSGNHHMFSGEATSFIYNISLMVISILKHYNLHKCLEVISSKTVRLIRLIFLVA